MAIKFSRAAETDLLDIFVYGIVEHGLAQAERYKIRLDQTFQLISDNPKVTRLRHEISPPVRVYAVERHIIIYTVEEVSGAVYVLRVRHHRENWMMYPID